MVQATKSSRQTNIVSEQEAMSMHNSFKNNIGYEKHQIDYWSRMKLSFGIKDGDEKDIDMRILLARKDNAGKLEAWRELNKMWLEKSGMPEKYKAEYLKQTESASSIKAAEAIHRNELVDFAGSGAVRVDSSYKHYDYFLDQIKNKHYNNQIAGYDHGWWYVYWALYNGGMKQYDNVLAPPTIDNTSYSNQDQSMNNNYKSGGFSMPQKMRTTPINSTVQPPYMIALEKLANSKRASKRAIAAKSLDASAELLDRLAEDPNKKVRLAVVNNKNTSQDTLAKMAISDPSKKVLKAIGARADLRQDVKANLMIGNGIGVLKAVVSSENVDPKLLDIAARDLYEGTVYRKVVSFLGADAFAPRLLFAKEAIVSNKDTTIPTLEYIIAHENDFSLVGMAKRRISELKSSMPKDTTDKKAMSSALIKAVRANDENAMRAIINHGGNPNLRNQKTGNTIIMDKNLSTDNVMMLEQKGADINATNNAGRSVLIMHINSGNEKIAEFLVRRGADLSAESDLGTAIELARRKNMTELERIMELFS